MNSKIKCRRKNLGLTQKQVAEIVGVSESYICKIERTDPPRMSIDVFLKLTKALGLSVQEVFGEDIFYSSARDAKKSRHR
jgi:DNA-binding XRE family transcriptional regulator